MLAAKLNPPLPLHKPQRTVLLRLWKSDIFQSTRPEIWLQGILRATACCALSWVLIITVLFVLAMAFGRFACLRLKISTAAVFVWHECELWALHYTSVWEPTSPLRSSCILAQCGELPSIIKASTNQSGFGFYWLAKTLQHLWWIHPFPLLTFFFFCNIGMQARLWSGTLSSVSLLPPNSCLRLFHPPRGSHSLTLVIFPEC